jgi:outer membrane protein assembly factor BamB
VWGIDLVREYGTKVPGWYTGQCPLIDNGLAIIAPAGSNTLMIAVECATGKVVWHTPNPRAWPMSHSSIMPVTLGGVRMFVYAASGGLAGIAADGPRRGMILWETNAFNHAVVAPSPVCMPDGKVFIAAGYAAGGMMLEVRMTNGGYTVAVLETLPPGKGLATEQQTPVFLNGLLYAVMPKDGGQHRNEFVCCAPDTCGTFVWTSGTGARFGLGPYIAADGKLFILDDEGELTMVRASAERWEPLGRAHVLAGKEAWGPMAIVSGRLLARDEKRMVCLDISAQ